MKYKKIIRNTIALFSICFFYNQSYADNSQAISSAENITEKAIFIKNSSENDYEDLETIYLSDDSYVVLGYYSTENWEVDRIYLAKYNKDNSLEWIYDNIQVEGANVRVYGFDFIELKDGGYLMTFMGCNESCEDDAFFIKYNSDGSEAWRTKFGGSGDKSDDYLERTIQASDGNIYGFLWCESTDLGITNNGSHDIIIIKIDESTGQLLNIVSYGGSGAEKVIDAVEVDDGFIIVGATRSKNLGFGVHNDGTAILLKFTKDLDLEWVKSEAGNLQSEYSSLLKLDNENYLIGGSIGINALLKKINSSGETVWENILDLGSKQYKFYNETIDYLNLNNSNILGVGRIYQNNLIEVNGDWDVFIFKYNMNGELLNIKFLGGNDAENINNVTFGKNGDIIIDISSKSSDISGIDNPNNGWVDLRVLYNENKEDVAQIYNSTTIDNKDVISNIRDILNNLDEGLFKSIIQEEVNKKSANEVLELKTASANLDLYIKSENILILSLDTNIITFEDFSGVEDVVKSSAVNITINSSLPYQLNAYLPTEIQNSDKTNSIDKSILNIKENSEADYKEFANINEKVVLKDNCSAGNDLLHRIDIKLKGGVAHEKDVYKTTIKFEAEQK